MAKKTSTYRVHNLAKELGVRSKDVVEKCAAEGVPGISNHMSTVSMGLAATIREWFSGSGSVATAVEQAAPVDVSQARARARKKASRKKKAAEGSASIADDTGGTAIAVEDAPAPAAAAAAPEPAEEAPTTAVPEAAAPPVEAPPAAVHAEADAEAETGDEIGDEIGDETDAGLEDAKPAPRMNVPVRPTVVKPVGPRLDKPEKTSLSGPKVIRVESPENLPQPRPRSPGDRPGPRGGRGVGGPDTGDASSPLRGGGGAGRGGPASRRNKRRSASARDESARPGRAATPPTGAQRPFNWREQDLLEREQRLNRAGGFFKAVRRDNLKRTTPTHRPSAAAQTGGKVRITEPIFVKELSAVTGIKQGEILKKLLLAGKPATVNSTIESATAAELMLEYGIELEIVEQKTAEQQIEEQFEQRERIDEQPRCPVVTILGHVDHGKTSLLDAIRQTKVAQGEAGGITQATSAFQVPVQVSDTERLITFIDTPGHEAFTEMRARGAKVTDIVVLVVAADDGVMPQTVESINHAKAADVPIIVALNKIDKPEATDSNIQRILGQLAEHELNPSEWGGSTEVVRISALKGEGIQELLEALDYHAQLLELKGDADGPAEGTVIEAQLEEGRGAVARVLVQEGCLAKGDFVVAGRAFGRIRDIIDDHGRRIDSAGTSQPVAFSGIDEVPDAGDKFYVVKSLKEAEAAADERRMQRRERDLTREKITLDNIFEHLAESGKKELPLIVKADVQGSVETLRSTLERISTDEVIIAIKHAVVGGVNDSDIGLAEASGAIIVCFNVTAAGRIRKIADDRGIDIRFYDVIYDLTEDVTRAAEGLLDPEHRIDILGHADVRDVFKISKVGMVAGCYVTDGTIERNAQIRVTRNDVVVEKDRRLEQLKRFKDDAKEVRSGQECGMKIEGYNDIKVGDVLECYRKLEVARKL